MERDAKTLSIVQEELETLAGGLLEVVEMIRGVGQVLKSCNWSDGDDSPSPSVPQQPQQLRGMPQQLPHPEASALAKVKEAVNTMRNGVRLELNKVVNLYYKMDLSPLFECDIAHKIRSFQVVTPEALNEALEAFLVTGDEAKRDDFMLLLRVGAQIDGLIEDQTALLRAVEFDNLEVVKILVGEGAGLQVVGSDGFSPLHFACASPPSPQIVRFLVSEGADVDAKDNDGETPLHWLATTDQTDLMELILSKGADIDAKDNKGDTALHHATMAGVREAAECLLDHGAKVNEENSRRFTPLLTTIILHNDEPTDHRDVAQLLISRGANINHTSRREGLGLLHYAAVQGSADVLELLLENGADVHVTDTQGRTALHHVASVPFDALEDELEAKKLRIAKLLVARGINVNALTNDGQTARAIAFRKRPPHSAVRAYLSGLPSF
uniref:Uncharacterized protein n=1 Tax=Chromera velia CCMP2878 TaxID=1169474 RepID=A0A0G4FBK7_9ALVE|eukprot:Cvel_16160.t1-p1 / transcript=Cvel_16160.t1 / gene=Cvel_16160 / organism=Chromera_velia_CCMP2878 / gene_product=Putative ankyrin repeat protein RF_0381, putative / transcript_product=Putative ankyrin repeat protein RF_0381, putative / location=Cvel_scaffold1231:38327-39643(+) / protein_length=439 / sequence_SO=supercontig / SO=protein_coding / is_pseudo=false